MASSSAVVDYKKFVQVEVPSVASEKSGHGMGKQILCEDVGLLSMAEKVVVFRFLALLLKSVNKGV